MMMPANFSAVAENEMTYVVGGGLVDVLAPVLTTADWQRFNTNLVTIIGNTYMDGFIKNTVGKVFDGTYGFKDGIFATYGNRVKGIWGKNYTAADDADNWTKFKAGSKGVLNVALDIIGNAGAIYNLATGTVKNAAAATWAVKTV